VFLGPAGSGAPFHFHKDALNLLLVGRKAWFLTPPSSASYSTIPIAEWVAGGLERPGEGDLLLCEQEEGDALYVPAGWGHAVLNLEPAAGVALEWSTPYEVSI
jgi:ribosomal protein L16 Arg81 hydroxylase